MPTACMLGLKLAQRRLTEPIPYYLTHIFCSPLMTWDCHVELIGRVEMQCIWVQDLVVVLDERGKEATSEGLAALLAKVCIHPHIHDTELS